MVTAGLSSEIGATYSTNQDACCIKVASTLLGTSVLAAICDGVGGMAAGELASSSVINAFSAWFESEYPSLLKAHETIGDALEATQHVWNQMLQELQGAIWSYGHENEEPLATTCTALLAIGTSAIICHIGDCRVYEIARAKVVQITQDQTLVARELARGVISEEEAKSRADKNVILQAVGADTGIEPVFQTCRLNPLAVYLLATDGAYRRLQNADIVNLFDGAGASDAKLEEACKGLTALALERGEQDNITALAFMLGEERGA